MQSIIGNLKKTKLFKGLVEKAAKEKMREEEQKGKEKKEKWIKKGGAMPGKGGLESNQL